MRFFTGRSTVLVAVGSAMAVILCGRAAGRFLIVDDPRSADAIIVLAGDVNDSRYHKGLQLLKDNWGPVLFVDARSDQMEYGRPVAVLEAEFVERSAGSLAGRVQVCPMQAASTNEETDWAARCLSDRNPKTVLLVTSDFHTRRALSIFRARLPQYRWLVAAARDDSTFGAAWWTRREWAKTALLEWTKLAWWMVIDRWRRPSPFLTTKK